MVDDCIFCKIIEGKIPSKIVYEDEHVKAILDLFPMAEGHTLVIMKGHYPTLLDIPESEIPFFFSSLKKVASQIKIKLKPDAFNILQNNGKAADQSVPHFHVHIIPRKSDDNLIKFPKSTQATPEKLDALLGKLK